MNMVNHPARSQKTIEAAVKRLINRHKLRKIDFSTTGVNGVSATAYPIGSHPIVEARRVAAYEAAGSSMSLSEARRVAEGSMVSIASGYGPTFNDALTNLAEQLDALPPPPSEGL